MKWTSVTLDLSSTEDYRRFLRIKSLPVYRFTGREASFPSEYASEIGLGKSRQRSVAYDPAKICFDYQRDIVRLALKKEKFAIFADCLAGESVIHSPDGDITIADACRRGEPFRVYAIGPNGPAIAWASAPWINGVNRLYRYRFESGREITATLIHRFLACDGWKCGSEIEVGESLAVSSLSPLASISDTSPQASLSDAQRSTQIVQGCQGGCSRGCRQCDEQPLTAADSDLVSVPLPGDVHERSRMMWRSGGLESKSKYSHQHLSGVLPSMLDCDSPDATRAATLECLPPSCDRALAVESSRICRQAGEGTILSQQVPESHPLVEQSTAGGHSQVCLPCDKSLLEWDTLVAVDYIRTDEFYDLEVPGFENFLANGVWSHNCGLGKSLMYFEYARVVLANDSGGVLIITPAMVVPQMLDEARKFYGDSLPIESVASGDVEAWLKTCAGKIGITNWEALRNDLPRGQLCCLILDESSVLKSHYGAYGQAAIELGKGLRWKLCGTGTPAPNDRIEYANHAVFLDRFPTVNAFLAKYFINRGETQERWVLKPHALQPFYRALSDWSIFLSNPATYGWQDNCRTLPPIRVHIHDVDMTAEQDAAVRKQTGSMFAVNPGGITQRHALSRIAKGIDGSATNKYDFIRDKLLATWPNESTIIWCWFNPEQDRLAAMFPEAASIDGSTPMKKRLELIEDFKAGRRKILISKPKVLGFGLNLQIATRHVFSSLIDSYEQYYQAIKRSNRTGSLSPLDVHIPILDCERPMVDNVLRKAAMVQSDTEEQEQIFREYQRSIDV